MKRIKNKTIMVLLALLFTSPLCYSKNEKKQDKNVEVTYIANEGFLIKAGDEKILIDAIFGDREYSFCDIPDNLQIDSMRKSQGVFTAIDLIAVTHSHADHFYAPYVSAHLTNNKQAQFISSQQSINQLVDTPNYAEIKKQLTEITPDSLTYTDTTINGIDIRVYRLIHGPYYVEDPKTGKKVNRHRNMQNLGFLFTIKGIKIFHCGDSSPSCVSDYKHFRLDKENIDIAFLGRGFMWSPECEGLDIIRDYLNPKNIILMHIRHDQNKGFIEATAEVKGEFPSVKVFEKRMETKNYRID